MKILFLHPYGEKLGDWNHRLKRQIELMSKECNLRVLGSYMLQEDKARNTFNLEFKKTIKEFKPNVIYVNGFLPAYEVLKVHNNIVYDMGSHRARNILMEKYGMNFKEIMRMERNEIISKLSSTSEFSSYEKEKKIIEKAKAVIVWEGEEAGLVRKMYDVEDKLYEISMMFYDLPKPVKWEEKQNEVMAVSSKWGKAGKNTGLLNAASERIRIKSVGHGGNWRNFVPHKELMNEMNKTKVIFCPYICGGIGVINEGLKLKCNVVIGGWHPYQVYTNDELMIKSNKVEDAVNIIQKAMKRYYPPKKRMPSEKRQLDKILEVCQKII